jgi:single-stranded-DNA-specific exonuclease
MPDGNEEERNLLVRELGIHWIISSILTGRHILTPDEARKYLYPSLHDLHNPFLMKDMLPGGDRMISAVYRKEKVVVYGDYDADGITSVAVLVNFSGRSRPTPAITYPIGSRRDMAEPKRSTGSRTAVLH